MSRIHYFADGYCLEDGGPVRQATWICMFNPTNRDADLQISFYYEDCPPTTMQHAIKAESAHNLALMQCKEVHKNKRFGAKIKSSEPIVVQITTGYYGVEDMEDWYTRAMHSVICSDSLATVQYYADGLVLDTEGVRLKEPEWAFLLNPNKVAAEVTLHACYSDQKKAYAFKVEPERLLPIFMDDLVIKNHLFGAKYVSSIPIAVQQTRLIDEEDRKTIRSCYSVMAKAGPLPWQDESEL